MRFGFAFLSVAFALLLAGLPIPAQGQEISRGPQEAGIAVLRELSIRDAKLSFRVDSGGCTDAGSFKIRVRKVKGAAPRTAHYWLTIERVRIDECKAMLWEGVVLEYGLARDLGLKGRYGIAVTNPVLPDLKAATLRAIELESEATRQKLKAAGEGAGPKQNEERFRQKLRDLEAEQARIAGLEPERYPAPALAPVEPGSVLEGSAGSGPVLPPEIRGVTVRLDGPAAEGALLPVQGASKSGPFYRLAGIAGGDYGILNPGREYWVQLCLVYRREYFGLIGDYYVYVLEAR